MIFFKETQEGRSKTPKIPFRSTCLTANYAIYHGHCNFQVGRHVLRERETVQ